MIAGAASLESFCVTSGACDVGEVLNALVEHHRETLKDLDISSSEINLGQLDELLFCRRVLKKFRNLKHVTMNVLVPLYPNLSFDPDDYRGLVSLLPSIDCIEVNIAVILPAAIRTLSLTSAGIRSEFSDRANELLDHTVAKTIRSRLLKNLETCFLVAVHPYVGVSLWASQQACWMTDSDITFFGETLAAGEKHGIEVVTWWPCDPEVINRRKDELGVARPVTDADFQTDIRKDEAGFRRKALEAQKEVEQLTARCQL